MAATTNQRFGVLSSLNFATISEEDEDTLHPNAPMNTLTFVVVSGGG